MSGNLCVVTDAHALRYQYNKSLNVAAMQLSFFYLAAAVSLEHTAPTIHQPANFRGSCRYVYIVLRGDLLGDHALSHADALFHRTCQIGPLPSPCHS